MEYQTNIAERRVSGYNSLRRDNANRLLQDQDIKEKEVYHTVGSFSASVGKTLVATNSRESTTAFVHRPIVSSVKKSSHTGPLKKRSPKPSPSKKRWLGSPIFTPPPVSQSSVVLRAQTSESALSTLDSASFSDAFRRKLTPSLPQNKQGEGLFEYPVKRNLNNELMKHEILITPKPVSFRRVKLSNNTVFSNLAQQTSLIPRLTPFSSSNQKKGFNPVVTNVSGYGPVQVFDPSNALVEETRQRFDGNHIRNQRLGATSVGGRSSSVNNVLHITHPFGSRPRVTIKRACYKPIPCPLPEVPRAPTKKNALSENQIPKKVAKTKIQKQMQSRPRHGILPNNNLFSPILSRRKLLPKLPVDADKSVHTNNIEPSVAKGKKIETERAKLLKRIPMGRPDLFQKVPLTKIPCKCKKTNCLKLYCECFHSNAFCDHELCNCRDCMNTEKHNSTHKPRGPRVVAMLATMAKNPSAFDGGGRRFNKKGCSCRKSRCIKKFCECFASGKECTEACSCVTCLNT